MLVSAQFNSSFIGLGISVFMRSDTWGGDIILHIPFVNISLSWGATKDQYDKMK